MAGVSSINSWKSIYYAFKVSLAMLTSALKDINLQNHSPYVNGNGSSHRVYPHGHIPNGTNGANNGASAGANNGASNRAKVNGVVTNGVSASPVAHNGNTANGADIVQPSGVES
jgi:hypothetical protein